MSMPPRDESTRPQPPETHDGCAAFFKAMFGWLGCDAIVTTAPPLIPSVYEMSPFRCPHGVTFYHAPTSEQIAEWARGGVA